MDDYLRMGFEAAVDTVARIVPNQRIHGVGYCIGGTLLSIGAAELAARGDTRIGSVTMFAAQTDFSEPGELSVFITPSQLDSLNKMMDQAGVLTSEQMGMSFALLRSADLLWGPAVNTYLRGKREEPNDLMAWNADGTRMPYRMHSEYLGRLYLNNDLANNRFPVNGKPVSLSNITVPMFVVGTETDHVAPWRSAYKTRALTESDDYTFLLTSGGHNAGIISGPSHPKRTHRVVTSHSRGDKLSPDAFMQQAEQRAGSWWPTWEQWLTDHSPAPMVAPPKMGLPNAGTTELGFQDAPGGYVLG
jgi:polyhydroxyalkanoate synthase